MRSHWFETSVRVINAALDQLDAEPTRREIIQTVREAYPFGPRERHPYKQWCKAQSLCLTRLYPHLFKPKETLPPFAVDVEGQLPLFVAGGVS